MFAFFTGIIALSVAGITGGWRHFFIFLERRGLRSHLPMAWHSSGTRRGTWIVVVCGTLWAAYAADLFASTFTTDWVRGAAFVATVALRWTLSAFAARIFLMKAAAGKF